MENSIIIKVDHVSMKFNLSSEKFDSFKEYVIKRVKGQVSIEEFWALNDVSFEVHKWEDGGWMMRMEDGRMEDVDGGWEDGQ